MKVTDFKCDVCGARPGEKCHAISTGNVIPAINSHANRYDKLRTATAGRRKR